MTDTTREASSGRWWTPNWSPSGPITKTSADYAFKAWIAYHAVAAWDPGWFEVPFVSVTLFAVFGLAKGLDKALQTRPEYAGGDADA